MAFWVSHSCTTSSLTLWVVSMCFSKYASLCNVLSQILHWIAHLFLSMCSFTFPAVVNAAGHLSHLCVFLSPTHFVTWLLLLLYGILFSQCLHVTSLCDSMCVFSFLPPMQVFSHLSQLRTRSSCLFSICTLRCFSEGASKSQMAQEGMVIGNLFCQWCFGFHVWWIFRTKNKKGWNGLTIINVRDAGPSDRKVLFLRQVLFLGPKKIVDNETLESAIEERCRGGWCHTTQYSSGVCRTHSWTRGSSVASGSLRPAARVFFT